MNCEEGSLIFILSATLNRGKVKHSNIQHLNEQKPSETPSIPEPAATMQKMTPLWKILLMTMLTTLN